MALVRAPTRGAHLVRRQAKNQTSRTLLSESLVAIRQSHSDLSLLDAFDVDGVEV